MQYNAPHGMYVFQNCSSGDILGPPFGAGTLNRAPPKSLLCAGVYQSLEIVNSTVAYLDFWKKALVVSTC